MRCNNCGREIEDSKFKGTRVVVISESQSTKRMEFCFECCLEPSFNLLQGIAAIIESHARAQISD